MKPFLSYISEVQYIATKNKQAGEKHTNPPTHIYKSFLKHKDVKKVSTTKGGHHVYRHDEGNGYVSHFFIHPSKIKKLDTSDKNATIHADLHVSSHHKRHKNGLETHKIDNLISSNDSTIRAHHAYHHLITHHNHIIRAYAHTTGSKKVWQRLSRMHGIAVHGWNNKSATQPAHAVNVLPHRDAHHEIYGNHDDVPDELVASKK